METPQNAAATKEFLVTGVSRSGRVRKKSSKLLDFQSPDELEKKPKRTAGKQRGMGRGRPPGRTRKPMDDTDLSDDVAGDDDDELYDDLDDDALDEPAHSSINAPDSDEELDEMVADIVEGVEAETMENASDNIESKVRQSLYMTEKANKRKMLIDGKVVTGKLERKDKGKSRFTAYSLWAREFRKTSKFSKNQDLDFSNAARRLGELWANVPNKEKDAWRRKAKIQATKAKAREKSIATISTNANTNVANNAAFYNRATTSRTKKLAAERQQTPVSNSATKHTPTLTKRKRFNSQRSATNGELYNDGNNAFTATTPTSLKHLLLPQKSELPTTDIVDAAAHLKLLGESLTIIGEGLKEHDGQIAYGGSLSVLLDSLICALGPLLCLTKHIPGMENKPPLGDKLAATLDNIAYVMPGL